MAATDAATTTSTLVPFNDPAEEDPENAVEEHDQRADKRKADFLSSMMVHHHPPRFGSYQFPFCGIALQYTFAMILVSLDTAAEMEFREKIGYERLSNERIKKLTNAFQRKLDLRSFFLLGWGIILFLFVFFLDMTRNALIDMWAKGNRDDFDLTIVGSLVNRLMQAAEFGPLLPLLEKNAEQFSMHHELHRLITCMLVHKDWTDFFWGVPFIVMNISAVLNPRMATGKSLLVVFLASLGGGLFHFHLAPNETDVGLQSIGYLVMGMSFADMLVNHDVLVTVWQLATFLGTFDFVSALVGLAGWLLVIFGLPLTSKSPVVMLAYLIYGFSMYLPFAPRLDAKHPGFLGHRPTIGVLRWQQKMKNIVFGVAMASFLYLGWSIFIPTLSSELVVFSTIRIESLIRELAGSENNPLGST